MNAVECSTNIDNTYYEAGTTYQLACPACGTDGSVYGTTSYAAVSAKLNSTNLFF